EVINTSGNINIYAPEYVEEKKRVIEEKLKGIEPKPVQEPKQKIKAEAPKIVVPAKVATPKPAPKPTKPVAPAAVVPKKITYIYFTDDKGNKITNSDYGNTIRATIGSTGLIGHTIKLRVYDKEWLGDPHLLTKDPIVAKITSNLCYVEIPLTEAMKKLGGNMWYDDVYVDIEIVETKAHIKSQSITVDTNRFSFDLPDNETKSKLGERDSKKETSECFCKQKENQFYWSNQLTCDQRKKVLQVCSELWGESKKKEKASELMSIFHLETGSKDTFKPYADNGKGYSGLIQFSDASAEKLGTTRAKLKAMTFIEQMDYVKKYLQKNKDKFATLTDFYLQVLKPNAVGQGGNPDYVLFDESVTVPDGDGSTTSQVQRMKNITQEPWVTKYGYASNPPFMLQDGENTKRKKWVYTRQRFEQRYGFMNGKTTVKEVTEVVKKQHYDLGKPNVFFGKCEKIKEEKKEVKDRAQWMPFALNEVGQKAISGKKDNNPRITEYFTASTNGNGLDEGTNWCGAFVSWCFSQANYTPPALSCRAAMWQFWKQDKPIYGSAAVIDWDSNQSVKPNGKDGAVGGSGHITFVVGISPDGNHYYCVGGNQGGVKGARTVKISKYSKNDIDWFVIPPNYIPTNEEYTLKVMNSEADVDTAKTTRT
ncbi:hypothetical protein, partial [Flavobacterium sp.]|uniref:hypothetical protein n=1 Tax=Flavobacterium sp. TaxID=239 RepID=UPI00286DD0B7